MNELTTSQKILLFVALSLATFMIILDYSIANISIPYIAGDLATSNSEGTYVITSFAVGNSISLAMTGWLTKRIGDAKLMVLAVLLFTLLSWICGLSISLEMLVAGRFIQGLVSGPVIPLSQSLILKNGTPQSRTRDLAIWATIVITAPVLGPILGGYISYWYTWPWIFYINIPVGIFCAVTIRAILRDRNSLTEKAPGDLPGILLLTLFVASLQIFLDKGQEWDWWNSNRIRILLISAIIGFIYLIIREAAARHPFLNLKLFAIPSFTLSIICLMVSYAIYFGTIVIVPLWLQEYMGYDAIWAGIVVSALGIGPLFFSFTTPWIIRRIGNLFTLMIALVIFAISCFYTGFFTTAVDAQHVAFSRFIFGFGFAYYINPLIGMSVQEVPIPQLPQATGIFHFVRAMVGAIGTSVFTTLFERRTIFHHERIGSSLTPSHPSTPSETTPAILANLNNLLDQESSLLAINDAFLLMGWAFVFLVALLLSWHFLSRKKATQPAPGIPFSAE